MAQFCVVGSLNMDMVARVQRFPQPGETISGSSFNIFPGGKGANQAVALARLGATTAMVGALGLDVLGDRYREVLKAEGVDDRAVAGLQGPSSGTAVIEVSAQGENTIVVVPGANGEVSPAYLETQKAVIQASDYVLLQLEIPMASVVAAARLAKAAGRTVILDPAPACPLPPELLGLVDFVTPNETEAQILTGEDTGSEEGIARAGRALLAKGVKAAIIKAGGRGAFLVTGKACARVPGFKVRVVDTVAAGDSFNAGLAYALGQGLPTEEAIRFANAVGGLSTTKEGAQSAMPSLAEVKALMDSQGPGEAH